MFYILKAYPFNETTFNVLSADAFNFELLTSKQQNFRLIQIESIFRQNKYGSKIAAYYWMSRKYSGKGDNAGDHHFLLFLQWFQKDEISLYDTELQRMTLVS